MSNTMRQTGPVGIIGAMKPEMDAIKAQVENPQVTTVSGIAFVEGRIHGVPVVVATSGIGKVFAAICAQTMILRYAPRLIINVGVAGSLTPDLNVGDIAVADAVVQHDLDTTGIGDPLGMISGLDLIELPCCRETADGLAESAARQGYHHRCGVIASGDVFIRGGERKRFIVDQFHAISCEMEGASVGHVCFVNDTPFCVLRAISDSGDENAISDYDMSLEMAADRATRVMDGYLKELSE
ncbi:MAG: 5'-methylthioadenosine/adenosylhomocysteine nucleosidase [Bacillota bacterium]|nr:5'-methylthioadenosine/adenosylhomocysteine nucleosidase [Bacillota bacterium]